MVSSGALRRAGLALVMALAVGGVLAAAAQSPVIRFQGRVSWIAGETLVVSTDESPSVRVDLSQVDQADYQLLASGDLVIVTGTIPSEKDRVVATSIEPLAP